MEKECITCKFKELEDESREDLLPAVCLGCMTEQEGFRNWEEE